MEKKNTKCIPFNNFLSVYMLLKKPRKVINGYRKASMARTHNQNREFSPAKGTVVQKGTLRSSENAIKDKYRAKVCSQSFPIKTLGEHQVPEVPNQKQIKSYAQHSHGTPLHLLFVRQTEAATHSQRLSVRPYELPILLVSNSHTEKNIASAKPNESPTTPPRFLCFKARLTRL